MSKYFSTIAAKVYGLIIAIMLRIVLPFILVYGEDTKIYSKKLTASVVGFYLSVSSVMSIIITIYPISTRLASLTKDWIVIGYIPLLIITINWSCYSLKRRILGLGDIIQESQTNISRIWWNYFNYNETTWTQIEKSYHCCGLEGPRDYLDYLQRIPRHCYAPDLITRGCGDLISDVIKPLHRIGYFILVLSLFMQIVLLWIYAIILFRKLASLRNERRRRKTSKAS